jgi:hypothetical protein
VDALWKKLREDKEAAMSREALSLEISQAVSRVIGGESIDPAARGEFLAAKYPELGMSGEMIGEAITRAANMVGMIKSAPMPVTWPKEPIAPAPPPLPETKGTNGDATLVALPNLAESIEESLTSAIDAEIGSLLSERAAAEPSGTATAVPSPADAAANTPRRSGPLAALRRAFFRP